MKKSITLSLLCAWSVLSVSAQDLVFTHNDKVLENEATITVNAVEFPIPGTDIVMVDAKTNEHGASDLYYLSNRSSSAKSITANATVISVDKAKPSWCMGYDGLGQCVQLPATKKGTLKANTRTGIEVDAEFTAGTYGSAKVKVEATDGSIVRVLYINLVYSNLSGIHNQQNNSSVRMIDNNLSYNFSEAGNYILHIYNLTGQEIEGTSIDQKGILPLEHLSKGIYICEVRKNGQQIATHKCIIK